MKYFREYHLLRLSITLALITLLLSGCAGNQKQTSSLGRAVSGGFDVVSYCAKEETAKNRIYFNYPQFQETTPDADKLNGLITGFVKNALQICNGGGGFKGNLKDTSESWKWDEDGYSVLALDVDYKITRNDSDYLSVTFEGEFNHKRLPHPTNYFNALVIDIRKCELVSLLDLYNVDDDFLKMLRSEFSKQIIRDPKYNEINANERKMLQGSFDDYTDDYLRKLLGPEDAYPKLYQRMFLTSDMVGVSMPLSHVVGDHFEVMISYDELSSFER
ncbi:MAG: hypothetical protein FWD65_02895 [Coriobacteriia bacterium]|nr:hypothetical protein [Coriobacteriia bacterium]